MNTFIEPLRYVALNSYWHADHPANDRAFLETIRVGKEETFVNGSIVFGFKK